MIHQFISIYISCTETRSCTTEIFCWFDCYRLLRTSTLNKSFYCAYSNELLQTESEMCLYCSCLIFILCILYWTVAKRRLRRGYTAAVFCLYCAYCIELLQSGDWDVVILQLYSVYIVHTVLNWCKLETEMR